MAIFQSSLLLCPLLHLLFSLLLSFFSLSLFFSLFLSLFLVCWLDLASPVSSQTRLGKGGGVAGRCLADKGDCAVRVFVLVRCVGTGQEAPSVRHVRFLYFAEVLWAPFDVLVGSIVEWAIAASSLRTGAGGPPLEARTAASTFNHQLDAIEAEDAQVPHRPAQKPLLEFCRRRPTFLPLSDKATFFL